MPCGQCGFIFFGTRPRPWPVIATVFRTMLRLNEHRGPYATGMAYVQTDGSHTILKAPDSASKFIDRLDVKAALRKLNNDVDILMGHTRWPTNGSVLVPENNHPIIAGSVIGTHNGWVKNADDLFDDWGLERVADVDSEIIFRLADKAVRQGDIDYYLERIHELDGPVTAIWTSLLEGSRIYITRIGAPQKPLQAAYTNDIGTMAYSSEFLREALDTSDLGTMEWVPLSISSGTWEISPQAGTAAFLSP